MELRGIAPVILGFLEKRPRSGYEIKTAVDRSTRFFWAASYGQIYPELRRLEQAGLVEGESEPRGGRRRRVYRVTETGRGALREWLFRPGVSHELRDLGLLKLFFADAVEPEGALAIVRELRGHRERVLAQLRAVEELPQRPRGGSGELVLDFGIGLHEWQIEWCKRVERELAHRVQRRTKGAA